MLVLTRRLNEVIVIDGNIRIEILGVKGEHIKLGFDAPSNVKIFRNEIFEKIKNKNKK